MPEACRYNRRTADGLGIVGYSVAEGVSRLTVETEVRRALIAAERGHSRRIVSIDGPPSALIPWIKWAAKCCISAANQPLTVFARATIYRRRTEARVAMIRETFA